MTFEEKALITALADRVLRLANVIERVASGTEGINAQLYTVLHEIRAGITTIGERMALVVDNVKDAQRDISAQGAQVSGIRRDITGGFQKHEPEDKEHAAIGAIRAFGALPRVTQALIIILLVALAAGGWLKSLL